MTLEGGEPPVHDNRGSSGWAVTGPAQRRTREDHAVRHVPADLRERLAATAERVAATFETSANARERMAAGGERDAAYHRMRGERHRAIAEFERKQAQALREGYPLPTPPPAGADEP